ncbi:MAG: diacylglycerol kinase family protein [Patescibacteria group bacterium]
MYYYIYDSFLSDRKYSATLERVESRLMSLGINGRIEKMTLLKSLREVISDAIKKGATTIIAVGNDDTVSKIINFLPNLSITLGIIPLGDNNAIATSLGIPQGEAACEVLSSRIIEHIDVGKANDCYFISSLSIPAQKEVVFDWGAYQVRPIDEQNQITICNFNTSTDLSNKAMRKTCNPHDGILEAIFKAPEDRGWFSFSKKQYSSASVFPFTKIKIKCSTECLPVVADGQTTIKTPVTVEVIPKKLKLIVGKNRMF